MIRLLAAAVLFLPLAQWNGRAEAATGTCAVSQSGGAEISGAESAGGSAGQTICFDLDKTCSRQERYGCFKGVLAQPPDKSAALTAPFGYIDPSGKHWDIPAGFVPDAAPVPIYLRSDTAQDLTSVRAAVLHDFYVRRTKLSAGDINKMFYFALLAAGTKPYRAEQMLVAVTEFGPSWRGVNKTVFAKSFAKANSTRDQLAIWHRDLWDVLMADERNIQDQILLDQTILNRPIPERLRIFQIPKAGDQTMAFADFIAAAACDHVLDYERDATVISSMRNQLAAELARPAAKREDVFVVQFTMLGVTSSAFAARNQQEFDEMINLSMQFTQEQEAAINQTSGCGADCTMAAPSTTDTSTPQLSQ